METFVIRLWSPADGAPAAGSDDVRGVARHVGSGRAGAFRDETELLVLLRDLPRLDGRRDPRDRDRGSRQVTHPPGAW